MAGFETIVRPVIFPNIRPAPAQARTPDDDPDKDKAVISGAGGTLFTVTVNHNNSAKRPSGKETKRRVDEVRIRPEENGGNGGGSARVRAGARAASDDDVWIDVEVMKKLWLIEPGKKFSRTYTPIEETENVQIMRRDVMKYPEDQA